MLLVEMTIGGTVHYISDEYISNLTHMWDAMIVASPSPVRIALDRKHGGYIRPTYGTISLRPDLFIGHWPPPASCAITFKLTETTEAAALTVFTGTAHRAKISRHQIDYELYGPEYSVTVDETDDLTDSVVNLFTTYCGASYLNLTLDSTAAKSPSPACKYTLTAEEVLIDTLSDIAAFFTHCFYISGGTLYLIDMEANNGTETLDEFDILPSSYQDEPPVSMFSAGINTLAGTYAYGSEYSISPVCSDNTTVINTALTAIKGIVEKPNIELKIPMTATFHAPGKQITVTEENFHTDITTTMRVRSTTYDPENLEIIIAGEGTIA